ncbi:MAG: 3-methyl-2-oxobutanoate hydroxymethyltransferase [Polyangiales bacterium]
MYGPIGQTPGATLRNESSIRKLTVPDLRARKQAGPPIAMLTAYDFTMGLLLDEGGADIILVGDSLGRVVQGLSNTLPVTVDEICYHGRAVARGLKRAHLVGDMPFMSFQVSPKQALKNAGKLMKEGAFEAVKIEGGMEVAPHVEKMVQAGIPVMGHVGLTPQSVHAMGGFKVQGKREDDADRILRDARALEDAGAYAIVVEAVPADLAARITEALAVPVFCIGAGQHCDGQLLFCYDFLGMFRGMRPKFVKRYAELGDAIVEATRSYVAEVQSGAFPKDEHSFGMKVVAKKTA